MQENSLSWLGKPVTAAQEILSGRRVAARVQGNVKEVRETRIAGPLFSTIALVTRDQGGYFVVDINDLREAPCPTTHP